jgi:hypothetical protein
VIGGLSIPLLAGHLEEEAVMPVVTEEQPTAVRRRGRYPKESCSDAAALVIDQKRTGPRIGH